MIYISKGFETKELESVEAKTSDFDTIVKSKTMAFEDVSRLDKVKRSEAYYFIAGELSEPIRNNDTLLKKSLVVLDYDELDLSEEDFKKVLLNKINSLKFYAYPSIRNRIAGTRYRLILPTDRPYTRAESKPLIEFITGHIGIEYDESSKTWSQAMGLKTTFESRETFEDKCIYNEGIGILKVDNALHKMAERTDKPAEPKRYIPDGQQRKRKYTAAFMEELMNGVAEGGRDVWLTKQFGRMLALGFDYSTAYEWIDLINERFVRPPVSTFQLDKIVYSIVKSEEARSKRMERSDPHN